MCGIVGYIGTKKASPILLKGLKNLEYRGYDSAGMAVLCKGLKCKKGAGKIEADSYTHLTLPTKRIV